MHASVEACINVFNICTHAYLHVFVACNACMRAFADVFVDRRAASCGMTWRAGRNVYMNLAHICIHLFYLSVVLDGCVQACVCMFVFVSCGQCRKCMGGFMRWLCLRMRACLHGCVHAWMHARIDVCMGWHFHADARTRMYTHFFWFLFIYMYI